MLEGSLAMQETALSITMDSVFQRTTVTMTAIAAKIVPSATRVLGGKL